MKTTFLLPVDLHLFEGDAGAAAGTAAGTEAAAPTGGNVHEQAPAVSEAGKPRKKGDLSNVKYGKQSTEATVPGSNEPSSDKAAEAGVQATPHTLEARRQKFDELINSDEYKEIYTERTQAMINRRFGETKTLESENSKLREIADMLGQKYGITEDPDFSKLKAAVEGDDEIWAQAADEAGMTVEQYKKFSALQKKNAAFEAAHQNDVRAQQQRQTAERWMNEAQALQQKFPQFDLKAELSDRNFVAAIQAGVPMELVYKGKYYDQNLTEATQATAKSAEQNVTNNIRARGKRPAENGTAAQSAAIVKSDPSKLTLQDFNEIARRVANGEKITF